MNRSLVSFLSAACAGIILLGSTPAHATSMLHDSSKGVHPHDLPGRKTVRGDDGHSIVERDYRALYQFYYKSPHRSQTHALHPFNRYRYWETRPYAFVTANRFGRALRAEAFEYDARTRSWVPATNPDFAITRGVCSNYTRVRANQRTPAFNYRCIDGDKVVQEAKEARR